MSPLVGAAWRRLRAWDRALVQRIDHRFYRGVRDSWDEWILREHVLAALRENSVMLDLGAGRGASSILDFRGACPKICAVDVDPAVLENPHVHEARVSSGAAIPYDDASFDVVIACNVLEHLSDPEPVFREVARVLVSGGRFIVKTPNRWHYMPLVASLTPQRFHEAYNALRGRPTHDTFPTAYRANTAGRIQALGERVGLSLRWIERLESRPEYLRWTTLVYPFGIAYERIVNASSWFEGGRVVLIAELERS